ncbi:MAG: hypothetical protein AB1659_06045, partial [Thermodesulfobacteriota bacterium]
MFSKSLLCKTLSIPFLLTVFLPLFYQVADGYAKTDTEQIVKMVQPIENLEVIGKKPLFKFTIEAPFSRENILVLLDGTDITPVIEIVSGGFTYTPIQIMAAGGHQIVVMGYTLDGEEFSYEFAFSSRHSQTFDEAYSTNDLTAVYSSIVSKSDDIDLPYTKVEANLASNSALKGNRWDISLKGNLRYLDQSDPVLEPQQKGIDLIDYLLTTSFTQDQLSLQAQAGDTIINQSENTLNQLARRGGTLSINYDDFTLSGFVVRGDEVYGFDGGLGLKTDDTDHIMGFSGEYSLLSKRITLKGFSIRGGEEGSFFGTSRDESAQKGNVYGLYLKTDFADGKFITEAEYDYARFDPDTTDDLGSDGDKAYRVGASGLFEKFDYKAAYKYFGRYYGVVGNRWLEKDWEGVVLEGGLNLTDHGIRAIYDQHHDN